MYGRRTAKIVGSMCRVLPRTPNNVGGRTTIPESTLWLQRTACMLPVACPNVEVVVYDRCSADVVLGMTNRKTFPNLKMVASNSEFQPCLFDQYPDLVYCQTDLDDFDDETTGAVSVTEEEIVKYNMYADIVEYVEV